MASFLEKVNNVLSPIDSQINKLSNYLIWGLAYISLTSCLLRNDYNIIFSFLMLFIYSNFNSEQKKYHSKILIHLVLGLILADFIWIFLINSSSKNKKTLNFKYYESLMGIENFIFYLGVIEIIIKFLIFLLVIYDYRKIFPTEMKFLINFDYKIPDMHHEERIVKPAQSEKQNIENINNARNIDIKNENNANISSIFSPSNNCE